MAVSNTSESDLGLMEESEKADSATGGQHTPVERDVFLMPDGSLADSEMNEVAIRKNNYVIYREGQSPLVVKPTGGRPKICGPLTLTTDTTTTSSGKCRPLTQQGAGLGSTDLFSQSQMDSDDNGLPTAGQSGPTDSQDDEEEEIEDMTEERLHTEADRLRKAGMTKSRRYDDIKANIRFREIIATTMDTAITGAMAPMQKLAEVTQRMHEQGRQAEAGRWDKLNRYLETLVSVTQTLTSMQNVPAPQPVHATMPPRRAPPPPALTPAVHLTGGMPLLPAAQPQAPATPVNSNRVQIRHSAQLGAFANRPTLLLPLHTGQQPVL